jgi:peptidoglycan/xylan/chitin deacetylase (PgdA/CDA1 family)
MLGASIFRIDRAVSLCVAALQDKQGRDSTGELPILMYHGINNNETASRHSYYETNTAPDRFRRQLERIRRSGYRACGLEAALAAAQPGKVALTFDDGYADFYENAYPVLVKHGFTATMFVVSDWIGVNRYAKDGKHYLTWSELREMQAQGIEIGSHTASHRDLRSLTRNELEDELSRSKQVIEDNLGTAVQSFAYPYAFPETSADYVALVRRLLVQAGYLYGVCTTIGTAGRASDQYFLPRLPVNTFDDDRLFSAKLTGAYDWMHKLQYAKKALHWGGAKKASDNIPQSLLTGKSLTEN